MNLDNEIKEIVAKAGGELPGEINLYCDTLHLGPASTIDTTQDLDLTIYAREIIITPARGEALITINASNTAGIGIYTPSFPTNLKLQFKTAGQAGRQIHPHTESGKTGFRANSPGTMARRETLDVVFADHLDCITPEGKMSKTPQWHDEWVSHFVLGSVILMLTAAATSPACYNSSSCAQLQTTSRILQPRTSCCSTCAR